MPTGRASRRGPLREEVLRRGHGVPRRDRGLVATILSREGRSDTAGALGDAGGACGAEATQQRRGGGHHDVGREEVVDGRQRHALQAADPGELVRTAQKVGVRLRVVVGVRMVGVLQPVPLSDANDGVAHEAAQHDTVGLIAVMRSPSAPGQERQGVLLAVRSGSASGAAPRGRRPPAHAAGRRARGPPHRGPHRAAGGTAHPAASGATGGIAHPAPTCSPAVQAPRTGPGRPPPRPSGEARRRTRRVRVEAGALNRRTPGAGVGLRQPVEGGRERRLSHSPPRLLSLPRQPARCLGIRLDTLITRLPRAGAIGAGHVIAPPRAPCLDGGSRGRRGRRPGLGERDRPLPLRPGQEASDGAGRRRPRRGGGHRALPLSRRRVGAPGANRRPPRGRGGGGSHCRSRRRGRRAGSAHATPMLIIVCADGGGSAPWLHRRHVVRRGRHRAGALSARGKNGFGAGGLLGRPAAGLPPRASTARQRADTRGKFPIVTEVDDQNCGRRGGLGRRSGAPCRAHDQLLRASSWRRRFPASGAGDPAGGAVASTSMRASPAVAAASGSLQAP